MDILANIRGAFKDGRVQWRQHALERMLERGISRQEIAGVASNGKVIEMYEKDRAVPTCLILGSGRNSYLHVVIGYDECENIAYVVTVYRPDNRHFESDMTTRKKG